MEPEEKKRKSPKRLIIDIPEELHQQIKIRAIKRNISMRTWSIRALIIAIKKEQEHD